MEWEVFYYCFYVRMSYSKRLVVWLTIVFLNKIHRKFYAFVMISLNYWTRYKILVKKVYWFKMLKFKKKIAMYFWSFYLPKKIVSEVCNNNICKLYWWCIHPSWLDKVEKYSSYIIKCKQKYAWEKALMDIQYIKIKNSRNYILKL